MPNPEIFLPPLGLSLTVLLTSIKGVEHRHLQKCASAEGSRVLEIVGRWLFFPHFDRPVMLLSCECARERS